MTDARYYRQHAGRVIDPGSAYKHVMAIALDRRTGYKVGLARCIRNRQGDITVSGYVDRSDLRRIHGESLESFVIGEKVVIANESEILRAISEPHLEFLGLEDPDIWVDDASGLVHIYMTLPMFNKLDPNKGKVYLGHAVGPDLDHLEMTMPVIQFGKNGFARGAKELAIAPVNSKGFRYNMAESSEIIDGQYYSTIVQVVTEDMGKDWKCGEVLFHPLAMKIPWAGGHASPGPLFPKDFIDVGENKVLGVMNGREANMIVGKEIRYGMFSVGLYIYDYENGKIDWVSPEPFIQDSEAVTVTFASQFVPTGKGEGILYAHVDDSFVRAYSLNAAQLKPLLPK